MIIRSSHNHSKKVEVEMAEEEPMSLEEALALEKRILGNTYLWDKGIDCDIVLRLIEALKVKQAEGKV